MRIFMKKERGSLCLSRGLLRQGRVDIEDVDFKYPEMLE
jgi:hypothetical protein